MFFFYQRHKKVFSLHITGSENPIMGCYENHGEEPQYGVDR